MKDFRRMKELFDIIKIVNDLLKKQVILCLSILDRMGGQLFLDILILFRESFIFIYFFKFVYDYRLLIWNNKIESWRYKF